MRELHSDKEGTPSDSCTIIALSKHCAEYYEHMLVALHVRSSYFSKPLWCDHILVGDVVHCFVAHYRRDKFCCVLRILPSTVSTPLNVTSEFTQRMVYFQMMSHSCRRSPRSFSRT